MALGKQSRDWKSRQAVLEYLSGGARSHSRERRATVVFAGSVLYVAHGAKLALLWPAVGDALRRASLAADVAADSMCSGYLVLGAAAQHACRDDLRRDKMRRWETG